MTSLKRRKFLKAAMATGFGLGIANLTKASVFVEQLIPKEIRVGMVGLSVHSAALSQILNDPEKRSDLEGCKLVALSQPQGITDVDCCKEPLSTLGADIKAGGVKLTASMKEMLDWVHGVMIETNDGCPHLEEVCPALRAGKTVFVQ